MFEANHLNSPCRRAFVHVLSELPTTEYFLLLVHCKNVRVIITLVWSSQLHLFSGFYYTRMITVYKPHIEILIATFCFQNWWSRTAKALQSWETPNRCNSDNHSNFKMTLTFLQCSIAGYLYQYDWQIRKCN